MCIASKLDTTTATEVTEGTTEESTDDDNDSVKTAIEQNVNTPISKSFAADNKPNNQVILVV